MHIPFFVTKFRMRPNAHVVGGVNLAGVVLSTTHTRKAGVPQADKPVEPELGLMPKLGHGFLLETLFAIGDPVRLFLDLPAQGGSLQHFWPWRSGTNGVRQIGHLRVLALGGGDPSQFGHPYLPRASGYSYPQAQIISGAT
jgi:hypothetical protein